MLFTVLLDFSHLYVYKQLKKAQMSKLLQAPKTPLDPRGLNDPWPTGHDGASGPCSHMASFLHDRALVGICRWHCRLCLPTVVSGSIPGPI